MHVIRDTGPWVALLCKDDAHHAWARNQFSRYPGPFLTCEAVVAETCFLLARHGFNPAHALAFVERGVVRIGLPLGEQIGSVRALFERYDNLPASLADACLLRMLELFDPCRVLTLDRDFQIYRRHGRKVVPVISPWASAGITEVAEIIEVAETRDSRRCLSHIATAPRRSSAQPQASSLTGTQLQNRLRSP